MSVPAEIADASVSEIFASRRLAGNVKNPTRKIAT
jgi:hypothetical protein